MYIYMYFTALFIFFLSQFCAPSQQKFVVLSVQCSAVMSLVVIPDLVLREVDSRFTLAFFTRLSCTRL